MTRFFRVRLLGSALAASCLLVSTGQAQNATPPATASAFQPAPLFPKNAITRRTLPNGVRATVKTAPDFDQVCVQVWVKGGSRAEVSAESGMAHLLEVAASRGSKNFPATDDPDESGFQGAIRAVGGDSGALTSRDATFYSATVRSADFERALSALADAALRPDLSNTAIDQAKLLDADTLASRVFDPVSMASDLAYATAYAKHPYRRAAWGNEGGLENLTAAKARAWHKAHYVGKNITVVVVGKVSAAMAHAAIARAFKDASAAAPPAVVTVNDAPSAAREVTRRIPTTRECLSLAWPSPGINKPKDVVAMDTLLALWREGLNAPLRRALLRDGVDGPNLPLVAAYDVDFLTQRDPGLFIIALSGVRDRDAARTAVLDEVNRLRDKGISDAELKDAKLLLRRQYIEQSENVAGQAGSFGFYEMITKGTFADDYLSLCAQVTAADLQRVAKTYLSPEHLVEAEIVPLARPTPRNDNNTGGNPVITTKFVPRASATGNSAPAVLATPNTPASVRGLVWSQEAPR